MAFNPAQFHRSKITATGVVQSVCIQCGRVVGFSSLPRMLELADRAHVCDTVSLPDESHRRTGVRCSGV